MTHPTKTEKRTALADAAFSDYNFGDNVTCEETDGWESCSLSNEMSRNAYVRFADESDDDNIAMPSTRLKFVVRFYGFNDQLLEAYARDDKGESYGFPAKNDLSEPVYFPEISSSSEIIERIKEALENSDGAYIAELHNQIFEQQISYQSDSIFKRVDTVQVERPS